MADAAEIVIHLIYIFEVSRKCLVCCPSLGGNGICVLAEAGRTSGY